MKPLLVKGQVLGYRKTNHIRVFGDKLKNLSQLFQLHLATARTITDQFWIGKIGGMKKMLVQDVDIEMYKDVVESSYKRS